MNKFQKWGLRRLIKVIVRNHDLEYLFTVLRDECDYQWYAENLATREFYIREALYKTTK